MAHLVLAPPPAPPATEVTAAPVGAKEAALKPVNVNKPTTTKKRPSTKAPNARQQTKKTKQTMNGKPLHLF